MLKEIVINGIRTQYKVSDIDGVIINDDIEHIYETKCKCMKRHAFTSLVRRRRIKISKTLND